MSDEIIKRTDELMKELKFKGTDINDYLENNPESFIEILDSIETSIMND